MDKSQAAPRPLTLYEEEEAAQEGYWNKRFTEKREENKYDYSYVPAEPQQEAFCQICDSEFEAFWALISLLPRRLLVTMGKGKQDLCEQKLQQRMEEN